MEHAVVTTALQRLNGVRLCTFAMRREVDESFILRAASDADLSTGTFALYDELEGDSPIAFLTSSLSGLRYTLTSSGGTVLAKITLTPSFSPSRPVDFRIHVNRANRPPPPPLLASFLPLGCVFYSQLGDDGGPSGGFGGVGGPRMALTALPDDFETRKPLYNSETGCYLQNLGSRVKRQSNRNCVVIASNDGARSLVDDAQRVMLRLGSLGKRSWVCDYREQEIGPLLALAVTCAVLTEKTLCQL